MPTKNETLSERYFDDVYKANEDPWNFETSDYEKNKYQHTINALPKKMYRSVFEIGCSIGVLSEMLAPKCERLLAVDAAEAPLAQARKRLTMYPQVTIGKMIVPGDFVTNICDLILISEVGYYLNQQDLGILRRKTLAHLEQGGHLLLVHWTPEVHDYPLTGDEVHDFFSELPELKHLHNERHDTYRLDLFEKL